jgi:uncharacterized protein YeaO (DUF488 family)
MSIRIVRLGSPRLPNEGLRIGTVRRPPRGVPKAEFAVGNWYDTWLPVLSPSGELVRSAQAVKTDEDWRRFERQYRKEMGTPERTQLLDLLAVLSRQTNFSVGCYCEDETRCHRSILRSLLLERGAKFR